MTDPAFLKEVLSVLEEQKPAVAAVVIKVSADLPGIRTGNRFLWTPGKLYGSLGNYEIDKSVAGLGAEVLLTRRPRLENISYKDAVVTVFLEPVLPEPEILILGGGHVGQQVAAAARIAGYRITVIDDRPDFANPVLFPGAERVICDSFSTALQRVKITTMTFIVIVTRGHRYDYDCLKSVIRSPAAYIGMIGSRRRIKGVKELLKGEGISSSDLDRIHAPIGLDIGAETPAEIAISIMAEIIRVYRRGS